MSNEENKKDKKNGKWLDIIIKILSIAGSVIALLVGIKNCSDNTMLNKEIEKITKVATKFSGKLEITEPKDKDVFSKNDKISMSGKINCDIDTEYSFFVLAQDELNFFIMKPYTTVIRAKNEWYQGNILLATPGYWRLNVCVANKDASKWIMEYKGVAGFSVLPTGMEIIDYIEVKKK